MCQSLKNNAQGEDFDVAAVEGLLQEFAGKKGIIVPALQKIQENFGYLPRPVLEYVAGILHIPVSKVYGVATFYAQFRLQPKGKCIITLCEGTACHVNGAKLISGAITEELNIEGGETTADGLFTLEKVACIGCCSLSPVMLINGETHAKLTPETTRKIINEYRQKETAAQN